MNITVFLEKGSLILTHGGPQRYEQASVYIGNLCAEHFVSRAPLISLREPDAHSSAREYAKALSRTTNLPVVIARAK